MTSARRQRSRAGAHKFGAGRGLRPHRCCDHARHLQQNGAGDPGIVGADDAVALRRSRRPAALVRRARRDHPGTRVRYHVGKPLPAPARSRPSWRMPTSAAPVRSTRVLERAAAELPGHPVSADPRHSVVRDATSDFHARYHAVESRLGHPRSAGGGCHEQPIQTWAVTRPTGCRDRCTASLTGCPISLTKRSVEACHQTPVDGFPCVPPSSKDRSVGSVGRQGMCRTLDANVAGAAAADPSPHLGRTTRSLADPLSSHDRARRFCPPVVFPHSNGQCHRNCD